MVPAGETPNQFLCHSTLDQMEFLKPARVNTFWTCALEQGPVVKATLFVSYDSHFVFLLSRSAILTGFPPKWHVDLRTEPFAASLKQLRKHLESPANAQTSQRQDMSGFTHQCTSQGGESMCSGTNVGFSRGTSWLTWCYQVPLRLRVLPSKTPRHSLVVLAKTEAT